MGKSKTDDSDGMIWIRGNNRVAGLVLEPDGEVEVRLTDFVRGLIRSGHVSRIDGPGGKPTEPAKAETSPHAAAQDGGAIEEGDSDAGDGAPEPSADRETVSKPSRARRAGG